MTNQPDAIIIGTGVIGTAVAFEMAKRWKTLSLDRNSQIGHGSTAGSAPSSACIIPSGTAFAWEGTVLAAGRTISVFETADLAQFKECGCMVMRTEANGRLDKHLANSRDLNIPVEWDAATIRARLPIYALDSLRPPAGLMILISAHRMAGQSMARCTGRMVAM